MSIKLQQAKERYISEGYQIVEQLSPTSIALLKKKFFTFKKWKFVWVDEQSNVQISERSFRDLNKKLIETVSLIRILQITLFRDTKKLAKLKEEKSAIENEIRLRNCLGNMVPSLKGEAERCLSAGYKLKSRTDSSAVFERKVPFLGGRVEKLNLHIGPSDKVQRSGESSETLQERLDTLISLFKLYRKMTPAPGREMAVSNKQYELFAEIKALQSEMEYLGYEPNIKGSIL